MAQPGDQIETPRLSNDAWILNPTLDTIFMFSFLWAIPIVGYAALRPESGALTMLLPFTVLLSQGHKFSPHVLLFSNSEVRKHVLSQRPRLFTELIILLLSPLFISAVSALIFIQNAGSLDFYRPLSLLALVYTGWTYFHFSQQNYGVIRLYRARHRVYEEPVSDRLEYATVTFIAMIMVAAICTLSNHRLGFYLAFFEPISTPRYFLLGCLAVCAGIYALTIATYVRKSALNLPVFLSLSHFFALTAVLCLAPLHLALIAVSISHWTQSIFLASVQLAGQPATRTMKQCRKISKIIAVFLIGSTVMYGIYRTIHDTIPVIGNFGEIIDFVKNDRRLVIWGLLYFGLNTGINYSHFYLDRFIYRKNRLLSPKNDRILDRTIHRKST